jgi:son of sevenless-like protein
MDLLIQRFHNNEDVLKNTEYVFSQLDDDTQKKKIEEEIKLLKKTQFRVLASFKIWVEKHFYDFSNLILIKLIQFLNQEICNIKETSTFAEATRKTISNKLLTDESLAQIELMFDKKPPKPIYPNNFKIFLNPNFNYMEWDSVEIARQLTIIDSDLFRRIRPQECLSGAWAKTKKYILAPNIAGLTDRWNLTTAWVSTTVMSETDIKIRKNIMQKFIDIAIQLFKIQNFK